MPTIGEKIREVRTKRGLTQSDLSAGLVTASMISQIEADRAKPSFALLTNLANRLGMPVEYFMNDLDEQFSSAAYLGIANYYLLTEQPERALETLEEVPPQEPLGSNYQEYLLQKAICHRLMQNYYEAVSCIEQLRELAYRTQDAHLQFKVCKESGYVEYDLNNNEGAIHEWRKAIELGKSISESGLVSSVSIHSEMLDILVHMDSIDHDGGNESQADSGSYLAEAAKLSKVFINFRSIGDSLIEEAKGFLNIDVSRAKSLSERAVSLLDSARLVEQYIYIHVKLPQNDENQAIDPWTHAAFATATISPVTFIEAECERIEHYLDNNDTGAAKRRIERCLEILHDYNSETERTSRLTQVECRLLIFKARVLKHQGEVLDAIELLEDLADQLSASQDEAQQSTHLVQIWAQLILWYAEIEDNEAVFKLTKKAEDLVAKHEDHYIA
jgi:transcriptional regulator with XRE-family HTH domain